MAAIRAIEERIAQLAPTIPPGGTSMLWQQWPGPWPRSEAEEPEFWRSYWAYVAAHYQLSAAEAAALQDVGALYYTCFVAYPESQRCLIALRQRGLRLAVLTNFALPSIQLTLRHVGLDPSWFSALLSSAMIGIRKPDPAAYLAATEALGLPPQECVFVDDLLENVEAACALGMRGVLIDRQRRSEAGHVTRIDSLDGLLDLVAGWM